MMNIGLVISGNLTGFSRFYANDEAKKLLNTVKFNFDVHNLVSFLNNGEKLYAIFFSKDVVAVSLITNILDSFRRPGNLVVTVLIPRGFKIVDGHSLSGANALYKLLNELNDKFYERNFLNGMINQNPAVLMQDYYTEILSKFRLEPDHSQRKINRLIDVTALNKNTGYVSVLERNIPPYLSSLFRKSYEGYHHIFFASNAPQNIDEPAEEIVTYKVKIENKEKIVPGEVKLSDKIPFITRSLGEKDLPSQDFTYEEVISGEAVPYITGVKTDGETIVLNYYFPEEEKTIYFKFYYGVNEVPLHIIRPLLSESNGTSNPLSTDSWTFKGKEIYDFKIIKSGNSEYTVDPSSSHIELQRLRDGATHNVYVSKGWIWYFNPVDDYTKLPVKLNPITITLTNKYRNEQRLLNNITGATSERLAGSPEEWEMRVDSDYYESFCVPINAPYKFKPKRHPHSSATKDRGGIEHGTNVQRGGSGTRTQGNSGQQINLFRGENDSAQEQSQIEAEKKKRIIQYGIFGLIAIIICIGGWWGYTKLNPPQQDDPVPNNTIIVEEKSATKNVSFRFIDSDGDVLEDATIEKLVISFEPSNTVTKSEDGKTYIITYETNADPSQRIKVNVSFQNINMLKKDFQNIFEIQSLKDIVDIPLSVKSSDIKLYQDIEKGIKPQEYSRYFDKVGKVSDRNYDYFVVLKNKLEPQKPVAEVKQPEVKQPTTSVHEPSVTSTSHETIRRGFDDLGLTLNALKNMKARNDEEKGRMRILRSVLESIENGKCPKSSEGLSTQQKLTVNQLRALNSKIENLPSSTDEEAKFKKEKMSEFSNALRTKEKGENSIYTAREALKVKL